MELHRNKDFSDEDVYQAWQTYINTHPELHILINSMMASFPKRKEGSEFLVYVENPIQQQQFDNNMLDLLEFMREKLSNDSFQLRVELTDISNLPQILSPKEFLKKTVADNKVLGNLLSEIEAELT